MMWSKLRKELREFITPELRARIDIHCTCYHDAHDENGEVWITVDGKKVFGGGYYHWYLSPVPKELLSDFSIKHGIHQDFLKPKIESKEVENIMKLGIHETSHITKVLGNYLNTPFEDSLNSNNPIYKAFALIDKRLGKRKFVSIDICDEKHQLVKLFYGLRKECLNKSNKDDGNV